MKNGRTIEFWFIIAIFACIYLWHENTILKEKINACSWEIGTANYSIGYADQQLSAAHQKAWSDYQTMGEVLDTLKGSYEQRPNPCDKDYKGNLSAYPKL